MQRILPGLIWWILWILSWLPGFILRFFSSLIHAFTFLFFRYRVEVVEENLSQSFPSLTPNERAQIAGRFYRHFSELFLEIILLTRLNTSKWSHRLQCSNPEVLAESLDRKQNLIIVGGHFGNWEWDVPVLLASGYRVIAVFKPQTSEFADQLMHKIRQKTGVTLVPMKDTLRVVARELKEPGSPFALLLVADQIPARDDIRFWTPFLNQDTAFFTGAEKLATRFQLSVYYLEQYKLGFGSYRATLSPVYDGKSMTAEGEITRTFVNLLEKSIQATPHLWLWSHRRWKYRREEVHLPV